MCQFIGPKITKQRDWNKEKYNIKDILLPKLLEWWEMRIQIYVTLLVASFKS